MEAVALNYIHSHGIFHHHALAGTKASFTSEFLDKAIRIVHFNY